MSEAFQKLKKKIINKVQMVLKGAVTPKSVITLYDKKGIHIAKNLKVYVF